MYRRLKSISTKKGIIILFVLAHSVLAVMMLYTFPLINTQLGTQAFDLKTFGYSVEEALMMIENLDQTTIELYLFPQLFFLDVLYPCWLALLLSALMVRLLGLLGLEQNASLRMVCWLPFLAMIFDYAENALIAVMITREGVLNESIISATSVFTQLKGVTTTLCWLIVLVMFIFWVLKKRSDKKRHSGTIN